MARGDLVPDDVIIGMIRERLSAPDTEGRVHPGRLPAHAGPGPGAGRDAGRARPRHLVACRSSTLGLETAARAGRRAPRLPRRPSTSTTCVSAPPKTPGICDIDGSELYQRDDDTEHGDPRPLPEAVGGGGRAGARLLRRPRPGRVHRRRRLRASRSPPRSTTLLGPTGGWRRDRSQDRSRDRDDGAGRPGGRLDAGADGEQRPRGRHHWPSSTRWPRSTSAPAAACPRSRATAAFPGRSARRPTR